MKPVKLGTAIIAQGGSRIEDVVDRAVTIRSYWSPSEDVFLIFNGRAMRVHADTSSAELLEEFNRRMR